MPQPATRPPSAPRLAAVLGALLFASALLPLTPAGRSFVQVVRDTFAEGPLAGVVMTLGFGSPFLFGLGVALGVWQRSDATATRLVRNQVTMMHSQLILVAWMVWRQGEGVVAALPLLLFAVGSGLYLVQRSASERASGRTPSFAWMVRWGAMVIAAVAGWLVLQRSAGLAMGYAVHVAGMCAVGLVALVRPGRVEPVAAANEPS